jgi:hypothetical protein
MGAGHGDEPGAAILGMESIASGVNYTGWKPKLHYAVARPEGFVNVV